jgi:hypothetical protein
MKWVEKSCEVVNKMSFLEGEDDFEKEKNKLNSLTVEGLIRLGE